MTVPASLDELTLVFRQIWGPTVASIARWSGDLAVAEDSVQEACADAVAAWSAEGLPDEPAAWLLVAARRRALDRFRRESSRAGKELTAVTDPSLRRPPSEPTFVRDDELRMMFTCAHPALEPRSQLALTLRLVSGLTVPEISRALLQSETAVGQRITRAKAKIRAANIPLRVPSAESLPERTAHVLACIYSVFTEGYSTTAGVSAIRDDLCDEGVRLAGEFCSLVPADRDAHALSALVLLHDSRRDTRVDASGALIPLDEQDRTRWNRARIRAGCDQLTRAAGASGIYLPQAIIAAYHASAMSWQTTDWNGICAAYAHLVELTDSPIARANQALALGFRDGFDIGLAALEPLDDERSLTASPLVPSIRADLLRRSGRFAEAVGAYEVALERGGSEPVRRFWEKRIAECVG
ncbi:sigma-70 family RNA polymerase sigma factor [Gordonia sp. TBRC 11910]|uniref:Sigma-70 family RNA polymerase sigma factor n=1 Tax=Gordonia asplenii TaxID=2725283 RepID=A0A848KZT9_9ACTN|nr:sigma-70 family RNA polymerase sigma factor [Gordonia asplenii]NMO04096.1 sigma-70 family RNA polymerase sigma factor [Gordonia asplenii]